MRTLCCSRALSTWRFSLDLHRIPSLRICLPRPLDLHYNAITSTRSPPKSPEAPPQVSTSLPRSMLSAVIPRSLKGSRPPLGLLGSALPGVIHHNWGSKLYTKGRLVEYNEVRCDSFDAESGIKDPRSMELGEAVIAWGCGVGVKWPCRSVGEDGGICRFQDRAFNPSSLASAVFAV